MSAAAQPQPAPGPAWARGYPVEELRAITRLFDEYDAGLRLGGFSGVNEQMVATWKAEGQLRVLLDDHGQPIAAAVVAHPAVPVAVRDFTGSVRARIPRGAAVLKRVAAPVAALEFLQRLEPVEWLETWVEHPATASLVEALGLVRRAVKIRASSELVGVWGPPDQQGLEPLSLADVQTLTRLDHDPDEGLLARALAEAQEAVSAWADHYSSYNQRHSWSAVALRGYHPSGAYPEQWHESIEKPAEMNKRWKAEHPGWQYWSLADTPLYDRTPACHELVEALGGEPERVRLMRLAPGGGELTRHADIVDPTAGTAHGQYLRIHLPLLTNPRVLFTMWNLEGQRVQANMAVGSAWYLDTRKPHMAGNYGRTERIHLVADVASNGYLLGRLLAGEPAPLLVQP